MNGFGVPLAMLPAVASAYDKAIVVTRLHSPVLSSHRVAGVLAVDPKRNMLECSTGGADVQVGLPVCGEPDLGLPGRQQHHSDDPIRLRPKVSPYPLHLQERR